MVDSTKMYTGLDTENIETFLLDNKTDIDTIQDNLGKVLKSISSSSSSSSGPNMLLFRTTCEEKIKNIILNKLQASLSNTLLDPAATLMLNKIISVITDKEMDLFIRLITKDDPTITPYQATPICVLLYWFNLLKNPASSDSTLQNINNPKIYFLKYLQSLESFK